MSKNPPNSSPTRHTSQQFPDYVTSIRINQRKPRTIVSAIAYDSKAQEHFSKHHRTNLNSSASSRRINVRSAMHNRTEAVLPSFNQIKETMKRSVIRKHRSELMQLKSKLRTVSNANLEEEHKEIVRQIRSNNTLELMNPLLQGVNQDSRHIEYIGDPPTHKQQETLNQQLQFEVPTSFEFYINNKKKALYQMTEHDKENAQATTAPPETSDRRNKIRERQRPKKVMRYDAWYMPIKYWSKVKETANPSNTLSKLKQDPKYLFKNLYKRLSDFPLGDRISEQDENLAKQQENYQRNKGELLKSVNILRNFSTQITQKGGKAWVLKYRIFDQK